MRRLNIHFGTGVQHLAAVGREFVRTRLALWRLGHGRRGPDRGAELGGGGRGHDARGHGSDGDSPHAEVGERFPRYQMLRALERLYAGDLLVIAGDCSHAIAIGNQPAVFVYQPLLRNQWVAPIERRDGLENVRYYALSREGCSALLNGRHWYRALPRWQRFAVRLYE